MAGLCGAELGKADVVQRAVHVDLHAAREHGVEQVIPGAEVVVGQRLKQVERQPEFFQQAGLAAHEAQAVQAQNRFPGADAQRPRHRGRRTHTAALQDARKRHLARAAVEAKEAQHGRARQPLTDKSALAVDPLDEALLHQ